MTGPSGSPALPWYPRRELVVPLMRPCAKSAGPVARCAGLAGGVAVECPSWQHRNAHVAHRSSGEHGAVLAASLEAAPAVAQLLVGSRSGRRMPSPAAGHRVPEPIRPAFGRWIEPVNS